MRPGDFERAIERVRALGSPLAALYAGIESIDADRASGRITITLVAPDPAFSQVLALPSSAPVPAGSPQTERSTRPLPGVGPYRIQEVRPGKRVVLTRVDDFDVPGLSPGHVDRIALVSRGSPEQQTRAVITGSLDVMQEPAPTDLLPEIRSKYRDSYREEARASTIALVPDSRVAPLDDVAVRRAIGESLGGEEVERLFKGLLTTSCTVVPEILSGFRPAGSCPYDDRDDPSDLVSAREQIDEADAEDAPLRVVPGPGISGAVARDVVRTLRKIGLAARLRAGEGPELRIERIAPLAVHPAAYLEPLALDRLRRAAERCGRRRRGGSGGGLGGGRPADRERGVRNPARLGALAEPLLGADRRRQLRAITSRLRGRPVGSLPRVTDEEMLH